MDVLICKYSMDMLIVIMYITKKFLTLSMNTYCTYTHIGVSDLNSNTTNTTIIITWDRAISPNDCGSVLSYDVIATSLADASDRSTKRPTRERAEFDDLIMGINYTISVAAVNRAGTGPSSTIIVTGNTIGTYCK